MPLQQVQHQANHKVFPNPSEGLVYFQLQEARGGKVNLYLHNALGQLLQSRAWNSQPNQEWQESLLFTGWPTGLYYYRIEHEDQTYIGSFVLHKK